MISDRTPPEAARRPWRREGVYRWAILALCAVSLALLWGYRVQRAELRATRARLREVMHQRDACRHLRRCKVDYVRNHPHDSSYLNNVDPPELEAAFHNR